MKITLIGMSGAGKTIVAKYLADWTDSNRVDIDELIEKQEGEKLEAILLRLGEADFLKLEAEIVRALEPEGKTVISTGGSIVLSPEAMDLLKRESVVVYLRTRFETIQGRIGDGHHRGIVGLGRKTLREIYDERLPLYERYADLVVEADGVLKEAAQRAYQMLIGQNQK